MKVELTFEEPFDVTPSGHDGIKIAFPFRVTRQGSGAKRDEVTEHRVVVDISGTRASVWGFDRFKVSVSEIAPTLFEYARQAVLEAMIEEDLSDTESIRVAVTEEGQYPFDPAKLTQPAGAKYQLDLEAILHERQKSKKRPLGFTFS